MKEKVKAKEIFDAAVARGETAGLLAQDQQASDVFSTELGNIPAGEKIMVEITYIGELKDDDTAGIRFTIPTSIAPRYGRHPDISSGPFQGASLSLSQSSSPGQIRITVDINLPEGLSVKTVQSPSHPIVVSMGTLSTSSQADPVINKASASLSLGSAALERDFVLIVHTKGNGVPKALLETHPTIPNHRALMATLVPRFSLPPSQAEIVFVADRSGSMSNNITMLISAMKVFLKSMPTGTKFNICSFGTSNSFLWPKSKAYSGDTLLEATHHVSTFEANYGGTETFGAIKTTVQNRLSDIPLEIILLTDGDIWNQAPLFAYVNEEVKKSDGNIRVFPLGIGSGVSHSLIGGLARAGNGFSQAVQEGERLDNSVVRMLRGALSPHITNYTLEVKYGQDDDDFEVVDRTIDDTKTLPADEESGLKMLNQASEPVGSGMKMLASDRELLSKEEEQKPKEKTPAVISLWDPNVVPEPESIGSDNKFSNVPDVPPPKILQAPYKIPSLVPFARSTVYLLMGPETIQRNPTTVILHATSAHGPLALEIPIEVLPERDQIIHQLAARKASQDLEESRGWVFDSKVSASYHSALAEKEAVRIGETFQVANKWCSFVAVSANDDSKTEDGGSMSYTPVSDDMDTRSDTRSYVTSGQAAGPSRQRGFRSFLSRKTVPIRAPAPSSASAFSSPNSTMQVGPHAMISQPFMATPHEAYKPGPFGPVGSSVAARISTTELDTSNSNRVLSHSTEAPLNLFTAVTERGERLAAGALAAAAPPPPSSALFGAAPLTRAIPPPRNPIEFQQQQMMQVVQQRQQQIQQRRQAAHLSGADRVLAIIELQGFDGSWAADSWNLSTLLGFRIPQAPEGVDEKSWITILVITFLETKMGDEEGMWALVVEKARRYVEAAVKGAVDELEKKAGDVVGTK